MKLANKLYLFILLTNINISMIANTEEITQDNEALGTLATENKSENIYLEEIEKLKEDATLKKRFDRDFRYPHIEMALNLLDIISSESENHYKQKIFHELKNNKLSIDFPYDSILLNESRAPKLINTVKKFCKKLDIECPLIFLATSKNLETAYTTYSYFGTPYVVIPISTLDRHSTQALEGTLAHELAHIKYKHVKKSVAFLTAEKLLIGGVFTLLLVSLIYAIMKIDEEQCVGSYCNSTTPAYIKKNNPIHVKLILASFVSLFVFLISYGLQKSNSWLGSDIFYWFSKLFEKNADLKVADLLDNPQNATAFLDFLKSYHQEYIDKLNEEHNFIILKIIEMAKKINLKTDTIKPLTDFLVFQKTILDYQNSPDNTCSSHPSDNDRVKYVEEYIKKLNKQKTGITTTRVAA